jgi:hypothetical protein
MLWLASSPISVWRGCGLAAHSGQTKSWRFVLDGFMTSWSFDAFGSGSDASKRVGFSGPTMRLQSLVSLFGLHFTVNVSRRRLGVAFQK